jgi:hypothetical protein
MIRDAEYIKRVEALYWEASHLARRVDRLTSMQQIGRYLKKIRERLEHA